MTPPPTPIQRSGAGVRLRLKVLTRGPRTEVVGAQGDMLRVRVAAAPVDGAANAALLHFLADRVSVPRSAVQIVAGESSRTKIVLIGGVSVEQVRSSLGF